MQQINFDKCSERGVVQSVVREDNKRDLMEAWKASQRKF